MWFSTVPASADADDARKGFSYSEISINALLALI